MKQRTYKTASLKKSRIVRTCDICGKKIGKGEKYGSTARGTVYCEGCK